MGNQLPFYAFIKLFRLRARMEKIKLALSECTHRWAEIESHCGFSITDSLGMCVCLFSALFSHFSFILCFPCSVLFRFFPILQTILKVSFSVQLSFFDSFSLWNWNHFKFLFLQRRRITHSSQLFCRNSPFLHAFPTAIPKLFASH